MANKHAVGDILFWTLGTTAGEGMFIGKLAASPDALVLIVGQQPVEIDAADCSAARRGVCRPKGRKLAAGVSEGTAGGAAVNRPMVLDALKEGWRVG
jgi:hypothetical protein